MLSEKAIIIIFAVTILEISALPLHRDTREATWTDYKANQAHPKSKITKESDKIYKTHIDDGDLYNHEDDFYKNALSGEMQRKLLMESERLRERLRHELAELRERLAPSPSQLSSAMASMRDRLAPLTQQLHNNTKSLCHQLRLYLHGPDMVDAKPDPLVHSWMTQILEQSGSHLTDILSDFIAKTREVTEHLRETSETEAANTGIWQGFSSRLGQEVISLKGEAQNSLETLKIELANQLDTALPLGASVERFCQISAQQNQAFEARVESLFAAMEDELEVQSNPSHSGVSLQEDFSIKLSALIEDILHSVQ
ncbi:uncharacterized protein zgc:162608 [Corythoichthys intestinalis]|uniref:uncharacterized protein zgc:162608 n=1 Tax=Corythoichthys intestinalis TaxID=161448 RepID=UPI0025A5CB7E|nr:uncharacterized protein zgc:162608 [Corythoichthys intestinalis]